MCSNAGAKAMNRPETVGARIRHDPWFVRIPLIGFVVLFLGVLVVVPLVNVFWQALALGWEVSWAALTHEHTLAAMRLTLLAASLAVAGNLTFGLAAAWAIARF